MNNTELIFHEITDLPDGLKVEVLDFIGYLKMRYLNGRIKVNDTNNITEDKLADLKAFFAPYRQDFGTYRFDREDANAR